MQQRFRISAEESPEPGGFVAERAPYQLGILEAWDDPRVETIVLEASSQIGKTLLMKGILGHIIDQDPAPTLFVAYSLDMGGTFSKDRFAPMLRDVECLRGKVADAKSRDSGNTTMHKTFAGGHITIVGANAPAGLASRPIRFVLLDEVDRYPASAGTEGDPVRLAIVRARQFWNRKILMASSPGDEETSRIHPAYLASDQRRFHVPCPQCKARQVLTWKQVKWTDANPETARYECEGCGALWTNAERIAAVALGKWVATFADRRVAGFHISELYSAARSLAEIVADFLDAKDTPDELKTFINTSLAEVWRDEKGEKADAEALTARVEQYIEPPPDAVFITMAVDVQDDRLELEFVGWGDGEESWGIEYVVLQGDPGQAELWDRASDQLARTFRRSDGATLAVGGAIVDTAGHYTKSAYAWAKKHRGAVYAIVGRAGKGRPIVTPGKKPLKHWGIKLHTVGVDSAKELLLMSRVKITKPGPGMCHWPASYPLNYFDGLTCEKRVVHYLRGQPVHVWEKPSGKRNEPLDLRVYGMALVSLIRPNFKAIGERIYPETKQEPMPQASLLHAAPRIARRPGNYLQR